MKDSNPTLIGRTAAALIGAGALLAGVAVQAQPSITAIYPDGSVQFQPTNQLSFTLSSTDPAGIPSSGISVTVMVQDLNWNTVTNLTVTTANGLTVSGPVTAPVVTLPLILSNVQYTAAIQATDATGTLQQAYTFDTVNPVYVWECEDFDYSGGQFFDNPQVDSYAGLSGTAYVDAFNTQGGGTSYRSNDAGDLGNEVNSDRPRSNFMSASGTDYDIGWTAAGNWANYTRTYPTGVYNVVLRAAGNTGGSDRASLWRVTGGLGTASQTLDYLGQFDVANTTNWQVYGYSTLVDSGGNPVIVTNTGGVMTYRMTEDAGGWNGNYFMLVPVNWSLIPNPYANGVSPNAKLTMFCATNIFTFMANSVPGITPAGIVVKVNGATPSGLTYSGTPQHLQGSFPLAPNVAYSIVIQLTDTYGSSSYSTAFGTYTSTNYTWECEDWDYNSGQFFDNPQVDDYAGLQGVDGVDGHDTSGGNTNYRPNTGGLGNEPNGDLPRTQFAAAGGTDYDIGWTAGGNWANYTRTYPTGVFSVVLRAAGNSGGNDSARLMLVTSGVGTPSQTTTPLGQFNVPNTGAWQTYAFTPMVDSSGNPASITNSGAVMTYQLYEDNGGWNGNFLMLVPQDTLRPIITSLYPSGKALFQRTNTLSFVATSPSPLAASNVWVTLDGVLQTNLIFGGTPNSLSVVCPGVGLDMPHTANIIVNTTNNDPAVLTVNFDTFSANYYTFEAEDWDYNAGQFFDNPQLDAYYGLAGVPGVDANNNSGGGTAYRANDAGDLGNEVNGDIPRAQYINSGTNDLDIGWTGAGNWANYTRHYPAGNYYVVARAAGNSGGTASLAWVTAGLGTPTQTTNILGVFNIGNTGAWQTYAYWYLQNAAGSNVVVNIPSSGPATFQMYELSGGYNINFFLLVPVPVVPPNLSVTHSSGNVTVSWTPAGGTLMASPALSGPTVDWQPVGTANPATVPVTGATQFFRVRVP